jgi:hypothetical protein
MERLNKVVKCLVEWLSVLLHVWEVLILILGYFGYVSLLFTQFVDADAGKILKQ